MQYSISNESLNFHVDEKSIYILKLLWLIVIFANCNSCTIIIIIVIIIMISISLVLNPRANILLEKKISHINVLKVIFYCNYFILLIF